MAKYARKDFEEHISQLSNEDLVSYIQAPEGTYRPEAITFARQLLQSRGLSVPELARLKELSSTQASREQAERYEVADAPIAWYWKPWITFLGLFVILIVPLAALCGASSRFSLSGETRKVRQLWIFATLGFGLFALCVWLVSNSQRERGDAFGIMFSPTTVPLMIFLPIVPTIFLVCRLNHFLKLQMDAVPLLTDKEFKLMKKVSGSALGALGISVLLVPTSQVLLYYLSTRNPALVALNISVVGLGIACLLDLKAEAMKKRGRPMGP